MSVPWSFFLVVSLAINIKCGYMDSSDPAVKKHLPEAHCALHNGGLQTNCESHICSVVVEYITVSWQSPGG